MWLGDSDGEGGAGDAVAPVRLHCFLFVGMRPTCSFSSVPPNDSVSGGGLTAGRPGDLKAFHIREALAS